MKFKIGDKVKYRDDIDDPTERIITNIVDDEMVEFEGTPRYGNKWHSQGLAKYFVLAEPRSTIVIMNPRLNKLKIGDKVKIKNQEGDIVGKEMIIESMIGSRGWNCVWYIGPGAIKVDCAFSTKDLVKVG